MQLGIGKHCVLNISSKGIVVQDSFTYLEYFRVFVTFSGFAVVLAQGYFILAKETSHKEHENCLFNLDRKYSWVA